MADNDNMQTMLEWSNLLGDGKPTDEVTAAMLIARTALTPYADKEQIDCGMGFGEACLDFGVCVVYKPMNGYFQG